jgi:hypothetical protein
MVIVCPHCDGEKYFTTGSATISTGVTPELESTVCDECNGLGVVEATTRPLSDSEYENYKKTRYYPHWSSK